MDNNIPTYVTILLITIPAVASIVVAYIANRNSKKVQERTKELELRTVSKEELELILGKYKELADVKEKDVQLLREQIVLLEKRIEGLRVGLETERNRNILLNSQFIEMTAKVAEMKLRLAHYETVNGNKKAGEKK